MAALSMQPFEERAHARRMKPVADAVWARYHELRSAKQCNQAPEGCVPSVIAQGLNDHGLCGDAPFPVEDLRTAEQFECRRRDVSVIVPAKNTRAELEACLRAVVMHAAYPTEIIVVDGGSTDGTKAMLGEHEWPPAFHVVDLPGSRSFSESCNAGARAASGRTLIFLNSDAIPAAKWDEQLLAALTSDPKAGASGPLSNRIKGKQLDYDARYVDIKGMERHAWEKTLERAGEFVEVRDLSGMCLAIPADVWDAVGEFDERFEPGNWEDNDWCLRATLQGYKLFIARGAFVHHLGQGTFVSNGVNYGKALEDNRARFAKKWGPEMAVTA